MERDTALLMQRAAEKLDHHFNGNLRGEQRHTGFILIAFPFGSGSRDANYISSGDGVVEVLECLLARLKGRSVQ